MQPTSTSTYTSPSTHRSTPTSVHASMTGTLRAIERVLLRGGQRTARRNAWNAVLEDRRRARDRRDTERVMRTTATRSARHP